jgi:hypothetical protein
MKAFNSNARSYYSTFRSLGSQTIVKKR